MIFAIAAVSVVGVLWQGAGPSAIFVAACAVAVALIPSQTLGVAVVGLITITTGVAIVAAWMRRAHPFQVLMFAVSDGLAIWALWLSHLGSTTWNLPGPGAWERGSALLGMAAVARIGAGLVPVDRAHMAVGMSGFWVGILLAWWAGTPALIVFAVGAAAILASALMGWHASSVLAGAGAIAAVAAGLGAPPAAIAAIAGAGAAMTLGAPVLGLLGWTAIPFGVVSGLGPPGGLATALALPAAPLVLALAAEGAIGARTRQRGGGLTGWLALGIGLSGSGLRVTWIAAAGLLAFAISRALYDDVQAVPELDPPAPKPVLVTQVLVGATSSWLLAAGGVAALWVRGLSTDFL